MKSFKLILLLFVTIAFSNCSGSDNEPVFVLSKANLVGTYAIESMRLDTKTTTIVSNFPVIVNANAVGSLFQVDLIFKSDNTYTLKGAHAVKTTITTVGSAPIVNEEIIVLDESGTYSINNTDGTITFTNQNAELLTGKLIVSGFSENKLSLTQEVEETIPTTNTTIEATLNISFVR